MPAAGPEAMEDQFTEVIKQAAKSTKPKGLMGLMSDNSITLKNLLFSGVVVLLELLLNSQVFDCPLNNHGLYGSVFLAAPVGIVFIANVVFLGEVWKLSDRCCVEMYCRCMPCKPGDRCCRRCECGGRYCRWGECCGRVCPRVTKAIFGPTVWLITSFADTEYYVCARVGPAIEKRNLTNETVIKALEKEFADAKSESHMLAWLFFSLLVLVTAIVIIGKKCCLKDDVLLEDAYTIERREAISALLTFRHLIGHASKQEDAEAGKKESSTNVTGETSRTSERGETSSVDRNAITRAPEGSTGEDGANNTTTTTANNNNNNNNNKKPKESNLLSRVGGALNIILYGKKDGPEKDEGSDTTGRFLGNEEEIILWPNGVPEQTGKKRVETLFENLSKKHDRYYLTAREKLVEMYPRTASGKPWEAWISEGSDVEGGANKNKNKEPNGSLSSCFGAKRGSKIKPKTNTNDSEQKRNSGESLAREIGQPLPTLPTLNKIPIPIPTPIARENEDDTGEGNRKNSNGKNETKNKSLLSEGSRKEEERAKKKAGRVHSGGAGKEKEKKKKKQGKGQ